jgi:chemotaxis protein histidine kinase CheA
MTDTGTGPGAEGVGERDAKIRFYRFANRLHAKTGLPPGATARISPEALQKAQVAIDEMAQDYPDWAMVHVDQLAERHKKLVFSVPSRPEHYKEIHRVAHDMKGQGGTFGYPLVSTIAESLYRTTGEAAKFSDAEAEIVKAHIDSIRVVLQHREKDPEGQTGKRVQRALEAVIRKLR